MRRREFIQAIAASACVWPHTVHAQAPARVRRIGVLMGLAADDQESQARLAAFAQGLQQAGWTVGQNIRVDYRFGAGNPETLRKQTAEFVAMNLEVVMAHSSAAVAPLLQESRTLPIVFTLVADPVGAGYVASLARPGGNVTGFTNFEYSIGGKWLELLKEMAPNVTRLAVLRESSFRRGRGSSARSRRWRRRTRSSCAPSTCAIPPRSSATSPPSRRSRTAG
jgi:putative tryptophan/tyrosine transport system substrate-binding protein